MVLDGNTVILDGAHIGESTDKIVEFCLLNPFFNSELKRKLHLSLLENSELHTVRAGKVVQQFFTYEWKTTSDAWEEARGRYTWSEFRAGLRTALILGILEQDGLSQKGKKNRYRIRPSSNTQ